MYVHPFPVYEDETFEIPLPTRNADGTPLQPDTAWADADFKFYKDGSTTAATIAAGATTPSGEVETQDGREWLSVDISADSDFSLGSRWMVWAYHSDIDGAGTEVNECICVFRVETAPEKAARLLRAVMLPDPTIATTTGNTASAINLSDILSSNAEAGDVAGELLVVEYVGGSYDGLAIQVRCTGYAVTNQLATVQQLNGDTLPEAVAAGDRVWRVGQHTATTGGVLDLPSESLVSGIGDSLGAILSQLTDHVISDSVNDASATATGFTAATSVGSDVRVGFLRFTSGALEGEGRLVSWTGTTVAVLSDSSMPTALKQYSAAPANSVTFDFTPL